MRQLQPCRCSRRLLAPGVSVRPRGYSHGSVTPIDESIPLVRRRVTTSNEAAGRASITSGSEHTGIGPTAWAALLWAGGESWTARYPQSGRPEPFSATDPGSPVDDLQAGFDIQTDEFARFNQRDDAFCRSWYDVSYQAFCGGEARVMSFYDSYRKPLANQWKKRGGGFAQRDFAFRNAAWHIADIFAERRQAEGRREGFLDPLTALRDGPEEKCDMGTVVDAAAHIKHAARALGADLVGITHADSRWQYSRSFSMQDPEVGKENEMPPGCDTVIVVGQSMDSGLIRTYPSALGGAATGMGYAHDVLVLLAVSQYIRNLGYKAEPTMNDTALAIPYALKAGLGEYGRHGLVITPEFGPRVRFGKIFTDMPLAHDKPLRFGVSEFCESCRLCADACPAAAIPHGSPSRKIHNRSNITGVRKWTVDGEKCFKYWTYLTTDCAVCVQVCPWNRSNSLADVLWKALAATQLRHVMLRLHTWQIDTKNSNKSWVGRSTVGRKLKPLRWWAGNESAVEDRRLPRRRKTDDSSLAKPQRRPRNPRNPSENPRSERGKAS